MEQGVKRRAHRAPAKRFASPAAGTRLYYLDDAGVLFSQTHQELHLLNATATAIWSLVEEGHDEPGIVAGLRDLYAMTQAQSEEFVGAALIDWRTRGFLENGRPAPKRIALPASAPPAVTGPPWTGPAKHARAYRLLSSHVTIRCAREEQARIVHSVLEHLQARHDDAMPATAFVDVIETSDGLLVYRDRALFARCAGVEALAPVIKSLVWMTALRDQRFFLEIHAGVVSDGARCLLLPAAPGSGKSTLTAALVHAGYEYFSDEVALLADRTLAVHPVPLAICVKDSGIDVLAKLFPRLRTLPLHHRGDGKRVAYMPISTPQRPATAKPRPVAALVFPRLARGAGTALIPLSRGEALQRLLAECLAVSERLDVRRVDALVRWIAGIDCYALNHDALDDAVAAIASIFPCAGRSEGCDAAPG
jgi:hypothetical protein